MKELICRIERSSGSSTKIRQFGLLMRAAGQLADAIDNPTSKLPEGPEDAAAEVVIRSIAVLARIHQHLNGEALAALLTQRMEAKLASIERGAAGQELAELLGVKPQAWPFDSQQLPVKESVTAVSGTKKVVLRVRVDSSHRLPTGERSVTGIGYSQQTGIVVVRVGAGTQSRPTHEWKFNIKDPSPSFLTFMIGTAKKEVSLHEAVEYWTDQKIKVVPNKLHVRV